MLGFVPWNCSILGLPAGSGAGPAKSDLHGSAEGKEQSKPLSPARRSCSIGGIDRRLVGAGEEKPRKDHAYKSRRRDGADGYLNP
jgi:hypothetical protein